MKYISTRNKSSKVNFSEALDGGLAPDGGLYVPESIPTLDMIPFQQHHAVTQAKILTQQQQVHDSLEFNSSLADFAVDVLAPFFKDDPLESHLRDICHRTFQFPIPLRQLDGPTLLLELFHGPTAAFKDVAAGFLAACVEFQDLQKNKKNLNSTNSHQQRDKVVLVATSGDTGSAVAAAFDEHPNTSVFILYPEGKVSPRQEKLLCCWSRHVHGIAVRGTFDDCQRIVKEALGTKELRSKYLFVSANSISVGRLLPQIIYYAWSSLVYSKIFSVPPGFIIPTGNLGNGLAAIIARHMGFPIREIIFAINSNQAISHYFYSGEIKSFATISTLANAMDVGLPSNLERLHFLFPQLDRLKAFSSSVSCNDQEIEKVLRNGNWNQLICPHTATAVHAYAQQAKREWILVATAHPAKFDTILEPFIQKRNFNPTNDSNIPIPENMKKLLNRPTRKTTITADLKDLIDLLNLLNSH